MITPNPSENHLTTPGQQKRAVTLAVLSALALAACGGGGSGSSGGGSGGGPTPTPTPTPAPVVTRFAYVANSTDNTVSIYAVDGISGALTFKGNVTTGRFPKTVVLDPQQKFAYVTNQGTADISIYAINQNNGLLTEIVGSPMGATVADGGYTPIVIDPTGRFAYVGAVSSNSVVAYAIDAVSGAITHLQSTAGPLNAAVSLAIEKTGKFLYAAQRRSGAITTYQINATTGVLTDIGFVTTGGFTKDPSCIAVDPTGQYALLTNQTANTLLSFNINASTGLLTQQTGSPVATSASPTFVAVHPAGQFALVSDFGGTDIKTYPVSSSASAATSTITLADNPFGVGIEPTGQFAYSYGVSNKVFVFAINQTTGALTASSNAPTGRLPSSIAFFKGVVPTRYAYVSNYGFDQTYKYEINGATGSLTAVKTIFASSTYALAAHPTGKYLYSARLGIFNALSTYSVGLAGLTATAAYQGSYVSPRSIAVHPNGRFMYAAFFGYGAGSISPQSSGVVVCSVHPLTGALTQVTTPSAGMEPNCVAVHPSGKFVYVGNRTSGDVYAFTVDLTTGGLSNPIIVGAGTNPNAIAIDVFGRFAYVTNETSNDVSTYLINPTTGALTAGMTAAAGNKPYGLTVDPQAKFAYVANYADGTVSVFIINQTTGALTFNSVIASGMGTAAVVIDDQGKFVYAVNTISGDISAYSVNPLTGGLTANVAGSPFAFGGPINSNPSTDSASFVII